ncbi:hypothetical protein MUL_4764 [Mycobacterium ulcerans Agy99]|uniref:Uncharacterized protein n=1 Tax=Mycobacterium ulcerans (strain Agy99) TaxID=362242 RepID=A0PWG5_MYCUA|nr:hypothetical protein MUL_4764 [Mycobacterium ulcerans Agy99]
MLDYWPIAGVGPVVAPTVDPLAVTWATQNIGCLTY